MNALYEKKIGHLKPDCRIWKAWIQKQGQPQKAKCVKEETDVTSYTEYGFQSKCGALSLQVTWPMTELSLLNLIKAKQKKKNHHS